MSARRGGRHRLVGPGAPLPGSAAAPIAAPAKWTAAEQRAAVAAATETTLAADVLDGAEGSLLDLVDHLLNQGVVVQAEVVLGLASIDLIYLRLTALVCAADRVLPPPASRA